MSLPKASFNALNSLLKTLYNYIDLALLSVINTDLPMKLRRSTNPVKVKKHKKNLGKGISERSSNIDNCEEFAHCERDTVVGEKSNNDYVILTILERKTSNDIIHKIASKTAKAVTEVLDNIHKIYSDKFSEVFKIITSDNGSEFADLSKLETGTNTKVYFTYPYS